MRSSKSSSQSFLAHGLLALLCIVLIQDLESATFSSPLGAPLRTGKLFQSKEVRKIGLRSNWKLQRLLKLRGGRADVEQEPPAKADEIIKEEAPPVQGETCSVLVSTSVGSAFLDKKKRLTIPRNATVSELKQLIEKKFPGCPPTALQRLFLGVRALGDEEVMGNITVASPTPLLLDMMSGTSVYNKTLSISQALEAYAASIVQQAYLGAKMRESFGLGAHTLPVATPVNESEAGSAESGVVPESSFFREMFETVNRTLYETYAEDIAEALEIEKEPETIGDDTAAWRKDKKQANPLAAALAKEFDLNVKSIKNFIYYSVLLVVRMLFTSLVLFPVNHSVQWMSSIYLLFMMLTQCHCRFLLCTARHPWQLASFY
jgi:hypothetical protein